MTETPETGPERPAAIARRTARSGTVDYSSPTTLYQSSKRRIVFLPYYIAHKTTGRQALGGKLMVFSRGSDGEALQNEVSLPEIAVVELLSLLQKLQQVASAGATGDYLFIRVNAGVASVVGGETESLGRALTALMRDPGMVEQLGSSGLGGVLSDAVGGLLRVAEIRRAVAELETSLDDGVALESVYQDWFRRHSWALGGGYAAPERRRQIAVGDAVDLVVPRITHGYRDLIELKRPDAEVLRFDESHRDYYIAPAASKAIGQMTRYLDVADEELRHGLKDAPELVAFHAQGTIIMGRSNGWSTEQQTGLVALNSRLHGITVMTFDHFLAGLRRLLEIISSDLSSDEEPPIPDDIDPDDNPF